MARNNTKKKYLEHRVAEDMADLDGGKRECRPGRDANCQTGVN